jgi:hypothetical protein|nr:MAG TPA_asm: hypothetical protein [Caudoviricetes sp.]
MPTAMFILNIDDMMFLNNKEKKEKANAISYKIEEYIWGRKDFVTDCPYGEKGRYTNAINKVGDLGCNTCKWQVRHSPRAQVVTCSHPKEENCEVKKQFKD